MKIPSGPVANSVPVKVRPPDPVIPKDKLPRAMQPDVVAMRQRNAQLQKVPVALSMDGADASAFLSSGKLDPSRVTLQVGAEVAGMSARESPQLDANRVMLLLSDAGKFTVNRNNPVLVAKELEALDSNRYYRRTSAPPLASADRLDPTIAVKQVLAGEKAFPEVLAASQKAGLPVIKTDDLHNQLLIEAYSRTLPGFADLPKSAQGPVAGLTEVVAEQYPGQVPLALRRQIAYSKISTHATPRALFAHLPRWQHEGVRPFSHGTTMGGVINAVGFPGDLQAEWNKLPAAIQEPFKGLVHFTSVYGSGTYTGNNSVASSYAAQKLGQRAGSIQVVSGRLDAGAMTTEQLDKAPAGAHTQVVPNASPDGSYYVTRGRKWLLPERITNLTDKALDPTALPAVAEAFEFDPIWASQQAALLSDKQLKAGLDRLATHPEPRIREAAGLLRGISGDPAAVASAIARVDKGATTEARGSGAGPLIARIMRVGPGHFEITGPLMKTLLDRTGVEGDYLSRSGGVWKAFPGIEAFGPEFKDLFEQHGYGQWYQAMVDQAHQAAAEAAQKAPKALAQKALAAVLPHLHVRF